MQKYFGVKLEFDHFRLREVIENSINNNIKGYVCIVDANVLTIAQKNKIYCDIINNSIVNSCDGSSIAMLAGFIHRQKFRALNGPEIFSYYIEKKYNQLLLGSTEETLNKIKEILKTKGIHNSNISLLTLPFKLVNEFEYVEIAKKINELKPDIIWVSLGAPKQELFMFKLQSLLSKGVMFGIGAAFNFYIGKIALPNTNVGALKFIWVSRIFSEPNKQLTRILPYLKLIPRLYLDETRKLKNK